MSFGFLQGWGAQVPDGFKKNTKLVYLLKLAEEKITKDNIDKLVTTGDIQANPLAHFNLVGSARLCGRRVQPGRAEHSA